MNKIAKAEAHLQACKDRIEALPDQTKVVIASCITELTPLAENYGHAFTWAMMVIGAELALEAARQAGDGPRIQLLN